MLKKGDEVKCVNAKGEKYLTLNNIYLVIRSEEPGIFGCKPYVGIRADTGVPQYCCASRFNLFIKE